MAVIFNDEDSTKNTVYAMCLKFCPPIHPSNWMNNRCDYANYDKDFRYVETHKEDVCHARAGDRREAGVRYTHVFFNYRHPATDEMLPHYIDWLVKESPFAGVFLSKNSRLIMQWGAVIDWSVHKGLAFGACIATRATWEHAKHMLLWWELVKAGVDKTYAYLVAFGHHPVENIKRDGKDKIEHVCYGSVHHGGVDPLYWEKEAIEHWFNGTTREGSENRREADATFTQVGDFERQFFREIFPLEVDGGAKGRFAAVARSRLDDWIKFHVENHKGIMEQFKQKKPKPQKVKAKVFGDNEPLEDF